MDSSLMFRNLFSICSVLFSNRCLEGIIMIFIAPVDNVDQRMPFITRVKHDIGGVHGSVVDDIGHQLNLPAATKYLFNIRVVRVVQLTYAWPAIVRC